MGSENKDFPWFANLCHRVNTLCSEANDNIPQKRIQYVRSQFRTAGESIKKFCSEVVDNVLPEIVMEPPVGNAPMHPKQEQNTDLPDDQAAKSDAVKFSSPLLSNEPSGKMRRGIVENHITDEKVYSSKSSVLATLPEQDEVGNNRTGRIVEVIEEVDCDGHANLSTPVQPLVADSCEKTEEGSNFPGANVSVELPDDEVICSASVLSTLAYNSDDKDSISSTCEVAKELLQLGFFDIYPNSDSSECISGGEAPDCCVTELGSQATQPSAGQKLDESIIRVMEADHLSYQKTEFPLSNKKSAKQHSCRSASQGDEVLWPASAWCREDGPLFSLDSSDEDVSSEEAPAFYVNEPSGEEMLDQSTFVVDISDYDMENTRLSYQKTTLDMKSAKYFSCKTVSGDVDAETDEETGDCGKETTQWDEDLSDSDWEFI